MKKYNPVYYLLFILLVMGAFASMAQNRYGLKIMGGVAFVFGLVFIVEFASALTKPGKKDPYTLLETLCLFILSFIFGLRVFYIHFPYVEYIFGAAALLLAFIYFRRMLFRYRQVQPGNNFMALCVLIFHLSIILFFICIALMPFRPAVAELMGAGAIILLLAFIIVGFLRPNEMIFGEKLTSFIMVRRFKDHSIIIVSLFLLFSLYLGLNKLSVLPGIYSDEFPRAYYQLVDQAASGKEKPAEGKYKHEKFKENYDLFLKRVKKLDQ